MAVFASAAHVPEQSHAFYMAITEAILELTERVRRDDPALLQYAGLDLSHAFEVSLYYAGACDAGLLRLFADPRDPSAVRHLQTPLAGFMAEQGFAHGAALQAVRRRNRALNLARRIKRALPLTRPVPLVLAGEGAPILFLARSLRFARFLRPLVDALGDAAGFLIPAEEGELAATVRGWGKRYYLYRAHVSPRGRAGTLIGRYGRYLAGTADSFRAALAQLRPRLVVVPEGNAAEDDVLARVAEGMGIASACIQQGWSPILHPGFRNLRYDAMLVWGEGFADLLAPANPRQAFTVTGNFHLADSPASSGDGILFLFQGFDNWMGGRESADGMVALAEAAAAALPERTIYVRPHPVVPLPVEVKARLARLANIRIEMAADVSLAEAFAKSRVSVSVYSSSILESVAAGVVPLIFNVVGLPRYWPDVEAAGAGLEVYDLDTALRSLVRLARDGGLTDLRPAMAAFKARFFKSRGPAALTENRAALSALAGLL